MDISDKLFISGTVLACVGTVVAALGWPKVGVTISATGAVLMFAGFCTKKL